jgi:hypothetical protein
MKEGKKSEKDTTDDAVLNSIQLRVVKYVFRVHSVSLLSSHFPSLRSSLILRILCLFLMLFQMLIQKRF